MAPQEAVLAAREAVTHSSSLIIGAVGEREREAGSGISVTFFSSNLFSVEGMLADILRP